MAEQTTLPFHDEPSDQTDRDRIATDLDHNVFVDAGAGSGKTHALVGRIVNLVEHGVPISAIAAITFTEKAAGELRTRVRAALAASPSDAAAGAIDAIEKAPIGTLHAFARRLLAESPIEAGLPPGFTVLDDLESSIAFDARWEALLDRLLGEEHPAGGLIEGGRSLFELCEFDRFGVQRGMRRIAEDFAANWDLVETRVAPDDPGGVHVDVEPLVELARRIALVDVPGDDTQAAFVAEIESLAARLAAPSGLRDVLETLTTLERRCAPSRVARTGSQATWRRAFGADGPERLAVVRDQQTDIGRHAAQQLGNVRQQRRLVLGAILRRFILDAVDERVGNGALEFHDLLVLARRLLAREPAARRALHQRYQRILLDEFQDTDPIQLEIAVRLTADPDDPYQAGEWRRLRPLPGRLFVVGDPKQSIYRFRRADIAQYLRAAEQIGATGASLSANFRSTRAVIDFVNGVFGALIVADEDRQPPFVPLDARRQTALLEHGSVTTLGIERHDDLQRGSRSAGTDPDEPGTAERLRMREADDVAAAVATALRGGWQVADTSTGTLRECRPGDIAILLPTRLALPTLKSSLRAAGVPFRTENAAVVYSEPDVRQLLLALRAADDSTDALALVEALRSPLYGCSDVELLEWAQADGRFNIFTPPPRGLEEHRVATGSAHLRSIAERAAWTAPAELLAAVAEERRAFDLALAGADPRDAWRRLRFAIEQARAWSDAGGRGVRRYLAWASRQASERRVDDVILPELDHDAVRVMTIHAAKGLEFPITVLAGLTTQPNRRPTAGVVWADDTWMLAGVGDDGLFDDRAPIEEQISDAERRRLLYVGCTRAVDHLVVSLHRAAPTASNADYADRSKLTAAELLWAGGAADPRGGARPLVADIGPPRRPVARAVELPWSDRRDWALERRRAIEHAGRASTVAATQLAGACDDGDDERDDVVQRDPGLDKSAVDLETPPWRRGRYGTDIGRAVHGVLQYCDLSSGADVDALARAQCTAEGIDGTEDHVAALVRSALQADIVQLAAGGAEHWRELFVAAPVGDRVIEGYVDLLVRTPDGLIIADYKTDRWSSADRLARHRIQLAAYGAALQVVLGEQIGGAVLVRCRRGAPAEQIAIERWGAAVDEVVG